MYVLAFDLSTTVLGYTVLEIATGKIEKMGYYNFKSEDLVGRGFELSGVLTGLICHEFEITQFAIEERLKSFRSGGTNADAMLNTAQLNFLCQYLVKKDLKLPVNEINVNSARSACFPGFHKLARARKDVKQKEVAFEMAIKALGETRFPKKILKSGPRKGVEVFIEEAKDMADSWVIGKAYIALKDKPVVEKVKKTKAKVKK